MTYDRYRSGWKHSWKIFVGALAVAAIIFVIEHH